ncbi:MAG: orotidine-5'-phosphate decarboxylase [Chloroflexota bacterium]
MTEIAAKYDARAQAVNSLLCVGLDSALERLPARFRERAHPQFAFNQWVIEQTHPYTAAYKLNTAFYEAHGADGWSEMGMTLDYLQANYPEIVTICDAKRADIGNTNNGYVTAVFDKLGFDAITLHPYLGREALAPFLNRADKASIILCHTSNPGADELQGLTVNGTPLWERVLVNIRDKWNSGGNCMVVLGATYPAELQRARHIAPEMSFLVPGVGAQGGRAADVLTAANANGRGLIVNSSRGIIFADDPGATARVLAAELPATR